MTALDNHNDCPLPLITTTDAPLYPAWAASAAPTPCQGKKQSDQSVTYPGLYQSLLRRIFVCFYYINPSS